MKNVIHLTIGYAGYFLIMFMALKAMIEENDPITFVLLFLGSLAMLNYIHVLEKQHEKPIQSGYIKVILAILFVISGFALANV